MRTSLLLLPLLASLPLQVGCTRCDARAGAVFAATVAYALASTDNPEAEWQTDVGRDAPEDVDHRPLAIVPPHEPPSKDDTPAPDRRSFDLGEAYGALSRVDVAPCKAQGLASGYGRVAIAFQSDGSPAAIGIDLPAGSAPSALTCVANAFRAVHVTAFDGDLVNVRRRFYVG